MISETLNTVCLLATSQNGDSKGRKYWEDHSYVLSFFSEFHEQSSNLSSSKEIEVKVTPSVLLNGMGKKGNLSKYLFIASLFLSTKS